MSEKKTLNRHCLESLKLCLSFTPIKANDPRTHTKHHELHFGLVWFRVDSCDARGSFALVAVLLR